MGVTSRFDLEEVQPRSTSAHRSSSWSAGDKTLREDEPKDKEKTDKPEKTTLDTLPAILEEPLSRATGYAAEKMRQLTGGKPSTWLRVVHSGYGSQAWVQDLKNSPHTHVATARHQEGIYVRVANGAAVAELVDELMTMNLVVRKKTQFKEMKRSNKSRLQFKATVTVFPNARQQAEHDSKLVEYAESETRASSGDGEQGFQPQGPKGSALEQMERRFRQGPGPAAPQFLQSYLAPPAAPVTGYTGYVEDPRPSGNPGYWAMPGTYDWEENGNSVMGFQGAVTEATQPMPQMFAPQGFPQAYQPQFQVQPAVPQQGGYYPGQQVAQPVYVCMVPAGMHPMQGMQAVQVQ